MKPEITIDTYNIYATLLTLAVREYIGGGAIYMPTAVHILRQAIGAEVVDELHTKAQARVNELLDTQYEAIERQRRHVNHFGTYEEQRDINDTIYNNLVKELQRCGELPSDFKAI